MVVLVITVGIKIMKVMIFLLLFLLFGGLSLIYAGDRESLDLYIAQKKTEYPQPTPQTPQTPPVEGNKSCKDAAGRVYKHGDPNSSGRKTCNDGKWVSS
jgi:hypothetical protein